MAEKKNSFMQPMEVSESLQVIVGKSMLPRTEVTKLLWAYIRKHDLQSRTDRRVIHPDAALAKVFGSDDPINMFAMTKKISTHLKIASPAAK